MRVSLGVLAFVAGCLLGWYVARQPGGLDGLSFKTLGYSIIGLVILATLGVATRYRQLMSTVAFAWVPAGTVAELIEAWQPEGCRTHKQYQKSLNAFLAENLPDVRITMESGSSRVRADIEVGKAVIVEMKVGFDNTAKLQQLLGQIDLYKQEFPGRTIITVFLGKADRNIVQNFKQAVARDVKVWVIRK